MLKPISERGGLKIISKIVDSIKRQECLLKSKFQAGMKFSSVVPKEDFLIHQIGISLATGKFILFAFTFNSGISRKVLLQMTAIIQIQTQNFSHILECV